VLFLDDDVMLIYISCVLGLWAHYLNVSSMERAIEESHKNLANKGGTELPQFRSLSQWMCHARRGLYAEYPHKLCYDKNAWTKLQAKGLKRVVLASHNKGMQLQILLTFRKRISYYALKEAMPSFHDVELEVQSTPCPRFWMKNMARKAVPLYTARFTEPSAEQPMGQCGGLTEAEIKEFFPIRMHNYDNINSPDVF